MKSLRFRPRSSRGAAPVLITDAAPSHRDQYTRRQRKYAMIMGARIPCLLFAGVFYQTWWLALGFLMLSVPLPWIAVLIANDSPPRKAEDPHRLRPSAPRQLEAVAHDVVDPSSARCRSQSVVLQAGTCPTPKGQECTGGRPASVVGSPRLTPRRRVGAPDSPTEVNPASSG